MLGLKILIRVRDTVGKTFKEKQCDFRKGRECHNQILTLRLIIKKYQNCQTPLVLCFID